MECLNSVLPIILYFLGIILLIGLIILTIKIIKTIKKVDTILEDVTDKVEKLDGVFNIVDKTTDAISAVSDKAVDFVVGAIRSLFKKRQNRKDDIDE